MGLRFDPIGGGQFKQAVNAIIEAESQPLKLLNAKKAKEEAKSKLFSEFKAKFVALDKSLSDISTSKKFKELKADLSDGAQLMSVTLDKEKAEVGQYFIAINELAKKSSFITNGFESSSVPLGTGLITFDLDSGDSVEFYIPESDSTLTGIANLITYSAHSPIRASVIRDESDLDNPYRLIFVGKDEGKAGMIDSPAFYFNDTDQEIYIQDDISASNAKVEMDGFEVELGSNDVNDFLPGINVHLKQARPSEPFTLTITEDYQKITQKLKSVIDAINGVLQFITKQNSIDDSSDTTTTFAGDTTLQAIEYRFRNMIHSSYYVNPDAQQEEDSNGLKILSEVGIEFEKTGQIQFLEEKFTAAMDRDFDEISYLITGPKGFVSRMQDIVNGSLRSTYGVIGTKERAMKSRIREIDNQIDDKMRYLEKKKQDLVDKFARLEGTLGNLQRQQQYLASSFGGSAGGSIASLLG